MALSGTIIGGTVASGYRLEIDWSATQSVSNNTSTVTAKVYWKSLSSGYDLYSSSSKTVTTTIDGTSNSKSGSGLATLSGNQRKHIHTYTRTVSHASNGTKSLTISASFPVNITLYDGRKVGTATASKSVTLNTIPRESSMTSNRNWTAGSNKTISISRHSTSFRHEVEVYVKDTGGTWQHIKQVAFSTSQTSVSTSFTTAQNTEIFQRLAGRSSAESRMLLQTFSGSTLIGETNYYGTVTAPSASTIKITNPTNVSSASGQGAQTVWVDQNVGISVTRQNSGFTHTIRFRDGNSGNIIHTATGVTTSYTWSPTQTEMDKIYATIPNAVEKDGEIEVFTYYNGIQVRSTVLSDINYRVRNSNPTFSSSNISYRDINSTTIGITNNNQYIIQGKSTLEATVGTSAKGVNKASISHYVVTVNGVAKNINSTTTGSVNMGTVSASSNVTMSIKAVDSRGFSTTVTKTVSIVPYSTPSLTVTASRLNGFEDQTTISIRGSASTLNVGGTNKNAIVSVTWRYKKKSASTYGSPATLTATGFPSYSVASFTRDFDNLDEWHIQATVTDKLGSTTTTRLLSAGRPILFVDSVKKSVGVNAFPTASNQMLINADTNMSSSNATPLEINRTGSINVNMAFSLDNGAIKRYLGINGAGDLVYGDTADLNKHGTVVSEITNQELWTGASYPNQNITLSISRPLSKCNNGWILVWSDYDYVQGGGSSWNNYNWAISIVPKAHVLYATENQSTYFQIPNYGDADRTGDYTIKTLYIGDTTIKGSAQNEYPNNQSRDVVLRKVYAF